MASPTFFRLSGLALLVGSLIFAILVALSVFVPGPLGSPGPPPVWNLWMSAVGGLILLVGLPALYTVQSKHAGILGLLGVVGIFVAFLLLAVVLQIITAIDLTTSVQPPGPLPMGQPQPPLSLLVILPIGMVLLIAGSILFGIATLRTRAFEGWAVWALMVFPVLIAVTFFLPFAADLFGKIAVVLFLLLFIWFGYKLPFQTNTFLEVTATAAEPSTSS